MNQSVSHRPVTLVEPGTVKVERLLPGPVERAWAYIVESDKRAKWLAAGEFDLRIGGKWVKATEWYKAYPTLLKKMLAGG